MAKPKKKKSRRKARNYCACPGVDPRSGKILRGFRANKRGGCPIPTKKARFIGPRIPRGLRKAQRAAAAADAAEAKLRSYTGRGYAEGYASKGVNGLRGLSADVRRRIELRRKKGWYRT